MQSFWAVAKQKEIHFLGQKDSWVDITGVSMKSYQIRAGDGGGGVDRPPSLPRPDVGAAPNTSSKNERNIL